RSSENGSVEPEPARKRFGEPALQKVAERGPDRQPQRRAAQGFDRGRARQQQVFDRWRLERAVVRGSEYQVGRRRPCDSQTRAQRVLIHDEGVVIPPQTGVDGPRAEPNLVLTEQRELAVRAPAVEAK